MSNPNPVHKFPVGNSFGGKPKGILTGPQFKQTATKYLMMTVEKIEETVAKKSCVALDAVVGTMILKAIEYGDGHRLEMLLNRVLGKVRDMETDETSDGKPIVRITKADGSVMEIVRPSSKEDPQPVTDDQAVEASTE